MYGFGGFHCCGFDADVDSWVLQQEVGKGIEPRELLDVRERIASEEGDGERGEVGGIEVSFELHGVAL